MQSVLNVRMDSMLKERGDKVLAEHGISVSEAVRALWMQLVRTRSLPEFMQDADGRMSAKQTKRAALEKLASIGDSWPSISDDASGYDAMMDEVYEEMWAKYEALS